MFVKDIWRIERKTILTIILIEFQVIIPKHNFETFYISLFPLLKFCIAESIHFIFCLFSFSFISKFYITPNK